MGTRSTRSPTRWKSNAGVETLAQDLQALSEPLRLRLAALLEQEELSVGELTRLTGSPQSTVSRHLKVLQKSGWVSRRAEGTAGWFRLAALSTERRALWHAIREAHSLSATSQQDKHRLTGVLAARKAADGSFFGRMHKHWDALRRELYGDAFVLETLLSLLPDDTTVADLGCGTGHLVEMLAPHVTKVIGVDREPAMLGLAKQRSERIANTDWRQGGLEALPLHDQEIDAALCVLVLHHVADLDAAMCEISRALKPGGRCVIVDLLPHDRASYRETMGHRHLGFDKESLKTLAHTYGLGMTRWRELVHGSAVQGPPLFVSILRR